MRSMAFLMQLAHIHTQRERERDAESERASFEFRRGRLYESSRAVNHRLTVYRVHQVLAALPGDQNPNGSSPHPQTLRRSDS